MYWTIIPPFLIVTAALAAPPKIVYVENYLILGNCYRRMVGTEFLNHEYLRDRRLTGNPYRLAGLENIPDPGEGIGEQKEQGGKGGGGGGDKCA